MGLALVFVAYILLLFYSDLLSHSVTRTWYLRNLLSSLKKATELFRIKLKTYAQQIRPYDEQLFNSLDATAKNRERGTCHLFYIVNTMVNDYPVTQGALASAAT